MFMLKLLQKKYPGIDYRCYKNFQYYAEALFRISILFMGNNSMLRRLQKLHNREKRIILMVSRFLCPGLSCFEHCSDIVQVYQRIVINILTFVFSLRNKMLSEYLCNIISYVAHSHGYSVRNVHKFRLNFFITNKAQNIVLYTCLRLKS